MSSIIKTLLISTAILFAPSAIAQTEAPAAVEALDPVKAVPPTPKDVDPALWVVKDEDTTIYLFGTVHILKPGLNWFDDGVKAAFDKSDRLVLEMVEPPAAETQALFGKLAIDQTGKTLRSKMNDADRAVYEAALTKIGLPTQALDPFDPWAAAVTMSVLAIQKLGFDINSGVEKQLSIAANAVKKPISGVETMEYQLGIFDNMPEEEQIRFLMTSAKAIGDAEQMMGKMVELWGAPDPDGLGQLMNEGLSSRLIYDALLTKRNANWAKWIKAEMDKPGVIFMAVGTGHLAGPTSVQSLLPAYGLTAERVAY
ncbi:TraB/GumN family protein [Sphingorhabdus sp. IMCC26285]|uniref:TraB/GumN family protein n=1 Tax=Sphingorhabdus profundilacus TaxID=2509718 RepID=A0A6I4LSB5_9SPHN|nr:TraB/GumN family protein [Sphingorhabdus profundilacus]MVZ96297.1 TraB/GumN family protein [Sphingorhabdus profundilacus]